jgi:hypothetical protein
MGSSLLFPTGWVIVNPWQQHTPSVIHALESVGETTTMGVVVFSLQHCTHHFGDVGYES